jgi:hypothetical protein
MRKYWKIPDKSDEGELRNVETEVESNAIVILSYR